MSPVVVLMVNTALLLLAHVPPEGLPVIVAVEPGQRLAGVVNVFGNGLIVTSFVVEQLFALRKVIIALPLFTPVTVPR
jgi:hypothetical protein